MRFHNLLHTGNQLLHQELLNNKAILKHKKEAALEQKKREFETLLKHIVAWYKEVSQIYSQLVDPIKNNQALLSYMQSALSYNKNITPSSSLANKDAVIASVNKWTTVITDIENTFSKKKDAMVTHYSTLETLVKEQNMIIEHCQQTIDDALQLIDKSNTAVDEIYAKQKTIKDKLEAYQKELNKLQMKLKTNEQNLQRQLETKIKSLETGEEPSAPLSLNPMLSQTNLLPDNINNLRKRIETYKSSLKTLKKKRQDVNLSNILFASIKKTTTSRRDSLKSKHSFLNTLKEKRLKLCEKRKDIDKVNAVKTDLDKNIKTSTLELQELENSLRSLEGEVKQHKDNIELLNQSITKEQVNCENKKAQLLTLNSNIATQEKKIKGTNELKIRQTQLLEAQDTSIQKLTQTVNELTTTCNNLQAELTSSGVSTKNKDNIQKANAKEPISSSGLFSNVRRVLLQWMFTFTLKWDINVNVTYNFNHGLKSSSKNALSNSKIDNNL